MAVSLRRGAVPCCLVRYEIPVYVGQNRAHSRTVTFNVLGNQLEEVQIPKVSQWVVSACEADCYTIPNASSPPSHAGSSVGAGGVRGLSEMT
jgi:hypothetical protein